VELLERKHLKAAAGAVRTLELQEHFPQAEPLYRAATVRLLLGRGRWSVAADWASEDPSLQLEARTLLFSIYLSSMDVCVPNGQSILACVIVCPIGTLREPVKPIWYGKFL
jgi:hypothetical protein